MRVVKSFLYLFCAVSIGLAHANGAEWLQVGPGVLLNESGEARCKITGEHGEFFSRPAFEDFVEGNPQAESVLNELAALRECDEGDVAYAGIVLNSKDIQIAGVSRPLLLTATVLQGFISVVQCLAGHYRAEKQNEKGDQGEKSAKLSRLSPLEQRGLALVSGLAALGGAAFAIMPPTSLSSAILFPIAGNVANSFGSFSACYFLDRDNGQ